MTPSALAATVAALCAGSAATLVPKILLSTPCAADAPCASAGRTFTAPVYATGVVFAASTTALLAVAAEALRAREAKPQPGGGGGRSVALLGSLQQAAPAAAASAAASRGGLGR
jgi:membrane protein implicated in regulation of membrane protease activity